MSRYLANKPLESEYQLYHLLGSRETGQRLHFLLLAVDGIAYEGFFQTSHVTNQVSNLTGHAEIAQDLEPDILLLALKALSYDSQFVCGHEIRPGQSNFLNFVGFFVEKRFDLVTRLDFAFCNGNVNDGASMVVID